MDSPLLVLGDLNIHHHQSNPLRSFSPGELSISFPYFSAASEFGFWLLNTPGVYTRFPLSGNTRPSVLDLAFANPLLFPFFSGWGTPLVRLVPITFLAWFPFPPPLVH